jgi:hypothetical protein
MYIVFVTGEDDIARYNYRQYTTITALPYAPGHVQHHEDQTMTIQPSEQYLLCTDQQMHYQTVCSPYQYRRVYTTFYIY